MNIVETCNPGGITSERRETRGLRRLVSQVPVWKRADAGLQEGGFPAAH